MKTLLLAIALVVGMSGCAISVKADWSDGAKKSWADFRAAQNKQITAERALAAPCKAKPDDFECVSKAAQQRP